MNTRTAHVTRVKIAAITAALAGAVVLSGCSGVGGSSHDGTYLSTSYKELYSMQVKGNAVTFTETRCDGSHDENDASAGELNSDKTSITWTTPGRYTNSDKVTFTENSLNIGDQKTYVRDSSDEGKAIKAKVDELCAA